MIAPPNIRDGARAALGRALYQKVAKLFHRQGILIMPIKGVLLQAWVYGAGEVRPMSDIDVLVPKDRFRDAERALWSAGFRSKRCRLAANGIPFFHPRFPMPVDLHRSVFSPFRFNMSTDGVFQRASRDDVVFDAPAWIPCPYDLLALLIGKFVSDHEGTKAEGRLREMERVAAHFDLCPRQAANRIRCLGLERAAQYALTRLTALESTPYASRMLDELMPFVREDRRARWATFLFRCVPSNSILGAVPAHLLNQSWKRTAFASLVASWDHVERRIVPGSREANLTRPQAQFRGHGG